MLVTVNEVAASLAVAIICCVWSLYQCMRCRKVQLTAEAERDAERRCRSDAEIARDKAILDLKDFQKKPDLDAADLLHDLTKRGQAVVKIQVIDPSSILLRSPRLG